MPKQPKKGSKKRSLPARPAGRIFWGSIRVKRTKKYTQLIITLPSWQPKVKKRPSRKKRPSARYRQLRQAWSLTVTLFLVIFTLFGLWQLFGLIRDSQAAPRTVAAVPVRMITPIQTNAGFPRSVPTRLEIPAISVDAQMVTIGKRADGSLEVPGQSDVAGWYDLSPSPGEIGPAIVVGHLDSLTGAAIFYELNKLKPDDIIRITREDKQIIAFKVIKSEQYSQSDFPTAAVYGNLDYPGLRLITCGGTFNYLTRHYSDNLVVYAKYIP